MLLIAPTLTFLLAATSLVSASTLPKRDVSAILADFNTIGSAITSFNTAVANFKGDITTGLAVSTAATTLDNAVKATTKDVTAASAFSTADSTSITNGGTLLGFTVIDSLNKLVAKKDAFAKAGFSSLVLSQLNTLHTDNGALNTALQAKVQKSDLPAIQQSAASLESAFKTTVAAFS